MFTFVRDAASWTPCGAGDAVPRSACGDRDAVPQSACGARDAALWAPRGAAGHFFMHYSSTVNLW